MKQRGVKYRVREKEVELREKERGKRGEGRTRAKDRKKIETNGLKVHRPSESEFISQCACVSAAIYECEYVFECVCARACE